MWTALRSVCVMDLQAILEPDDQRHFIEASKRFHCLFCYKRYTPFDAHIYRHRKTLGPNLQVLQVLQALFLKMYTLCPIPILSLLPQVYVDVDMGIYVPRSTQRDCLLVCTSPSVGEYDSSLEDLTALALVPSVTAGALLRCRVELDVLIVHG